MNMGYRFVQGIWLTVAAIVLSGCTHFELPYFGRSDTNTTSQSSSVDVSGMDQGVQSEQVIIKRIPFPADEYEKLNTMGDGVVKGTIAIRYNGQTVPGRRTRLYLNPVTSYSNQWYRESYLAGHKMGKSDPRLFNYLKFTAANDRGEFAFYGVPAGKYYVVGTVKCDACGGKNVRVAKRIRVGSSGTVTVELTKTLP
jgi:hypothetical protein